MGHGEGIMLPLGGLGWEAYFQKCSNGSSEFSPDLVGISL